MPVKTEGVESTVRDVVNHVESTAGDATPVVNHVAAGGDGEVIANNPPAGAAEAEVAREETRAQATNRWILAGQRHQVEAFRENVRLECVDKGMTRRAAKQYSWDATMAAFPASGEPEPAPPAPSAPPEPTSSTNGHIQGIEALPSAWPALPANASQQAELGWVQANRLSCIEQQPSGAIRVHLDRAHEPAPSRAALGWLETSIRSYAKYVDVAARSLRDEQDDQDHKRRERMAMDDIEGLLAEMSE